MFTVIVAVGIVLAVAFVGAAIVGAGLRVSRALLELVDLLRSIERDRRDRFTG